MYSPCCARDNATLTRLVFLNQLGAARNTYCEESDFATTLLIRPFSFIPHERENYAAL
jgi:hypothetical protein